MRVAALAAVVLAFWLGMLSGGCSSQRTPAGWNCHAWPDGITCNRVPF